MPDVDGTPGAPGTDVDRVDTAVAEVAEVAPNESAGHDEVGKTSGADTAGSEAGRLGGLWTVLVVGALITILILVFVLQNNEAADVQFLNWSFSLPLGVLILFSAIAGALVMAAFAGVRILQLRMRAHRAAKLRRKR